MKNLMLFYNFMAIPALVVHELMHVIATLVVFSKLKGIHFIKGEDFNNSLECQVEVWTVSKYKWQNNVIHMAPVLGVMTPLIFLFFGMDTTAFVVTIYNIITVKTLFPSEEDIVAIKEFKTIEELIEDYE